MPSWRQGGLPESCANWYTGRQQDVLAVQLLMSGKVAVNFHPAEFTDGAVHFAAHCGAS